MNTLYFSPLQIWSVFLSQLKRSILIPRFCYISTRLLLKKNYPEFYVVVSEWRALCSLQIKIMHYFVFAQHKSQWDALRQCSTLKSVTKLKEYGNSFVIFQDCVCVDPEHCASFLTFLLLRDNRKLSSQQKQSSCSGAYSWHFNRCEHWVKNKKQI